MAFLSVQQMGSAAILGKITLYTADETAKPNHEEP
ncbi:hypothetical protein SIAM614_26913 [Stappia aggregata IAM 12614]|uniref:Uncharacterized protein n=1 Tax=Roseibium aggregatum (strain ATCC 25650 / DSM 13394 / JCM 20685 / NBRC 16684 / NCIMB 2208 / IAM 12614 / B1) TaxID=384765 RepID=A0NX14_ROSAI|nr:hypothetical protein SIAM614_26913 [Stappia aggregata IAM 12614] [Roseibium aggregatum IAM 12614]